MDDTTISELIRAVASATGRAQIVALYHESSEEKMNDSLSVSAAGVSATSALIAVEETANSVILSEVLGCDCTDSEFEELCLSEAGSCAVMLDICGCHMLTPGSLAYLKHLQRLTSLSVGNRMGAATILHLSSVNLSLSSVNLSECGLHESDTKQLATALENNSALSELNLSGNTFDNSFGPVHLLPVFYALKNNTTLKIWSPTPNGSRTLSLPPSYKREIWWNTWASNARSHLYSRLKTHFP